MTTFQKFYNEAEAFATTRERVSRDFKSMSVTEQTAVLETAGKVWNQREEFISSLAWASVKKPVLAV